MIKKSLKSDAMFNSKSKSETSEMSGNNSASIISAGTTLKGDINSNADLRIDGTLIGNVVSTAKIIIGANGVVEGDLNGQQADILGKVHGKVHVKELLQLKGSSVVNGNIEAGKLQVEPTATFNGECHMNISSTVPTQKTDKKGESALFDKKNALAV